MQIAKPIGAAALFTFAKTSGTSSALQNVKPLQGTASSTGTNLKNFSSISEQQCDLNYTRCLNDSETLIDPSLSEKCDQDLDECLTDAALIESSQEPAQEVSIGEQQCDLNFTLCMNDSETLIDPNLSEKCNQDLDECLTDAALSTSSPTSTPTKVVTSQASKGSLGKVASFTAVSATVISAFMR